MLGKSIGFLPETTTVSMTCRYFDGWTVSIRITTEDPLILEEHEVFILTKHFTNMYKWIVYKSNTEFEYCYC